MSLPTQVEEIRKHTEHVPFTGLTKHTHEECQTCGAPLQERDPNANAATPVKPSAATKPKSSRKSSTESSKSDFKSAGTTAASLANVHIDGEETESVPIYLTCDDIRNLINAHLPFTSKAAFARELNELLSSSKVTTKNLDQLLRMKGPRSGAHNIAFYASYVFFEKIRVRDDEKKSVKRKKMEDMWKFEGGLPRKGAHQIGVSCMEGERPVMNAYGDIDIKGEPRTGAILRKKPRAS